MTTADDLIPSLERTVNDLLAEVGQLPVDVLYREPMAGEWPVMSILAHLAELLPFWAREAADLAREPGKAVGRALDDPRRVGAIEQHGHDSIADILPRIRAGLGECESTLRTIPSDAWHVVGQHPTRGPMSVEQLVQAFVANHAAEHARQIRETLQTLGAGQSSQIP